MKYPFAPKSTSYLKPGQFWAIPLAGGVFACGRVLQLKTENGKTDRRAFLAGLMDWHGTREPTANDLANLKILEHGQAHIKCIQSINAEILGCRSLEPDEIEVPLTLDESGGANCHVRRGFDLLGLASDEQKATLPVFSTWGYNVIQILANKHFSE
jgi:hypothetical protein